MINPTIRNTLYTEARNYTDRDAYISDLALSSIWGDAEDAEIPADRLALLGRIYDATHTTIRELIAAHHMTQTDFARFFCIPLRTVQGWCTGERNCPAYVVTMAAEILGAEASKQ